MSKNNKLPDEISGTEQKIYLTNDKDCIEQNIERLKKK